jgi:hypothetical protein
MLRIPECACVKQLETSLCKVEMLHTLRITQHRRVCPQLHPLLGKGKGLA